MEDTFAAKANEWDSNPLRAEMVKKFLHEVRKYATTKKTDRMIDFGCGTGVVGLDFINETEEVVFVDTSHAMLNILRQKVSDAKITNACIVEGSIEQSDKSLKANLITSLMSVHHVEDTDVLFRQMAERLHTDGSIIIGDLMPEDGSFHFPEVVPHNGFSSEKLQKSLANAGLSISHLSVFHTMHKPNHKGEKRAFDLFVLVARKA